MKLSELRKCDNCGKSAQGFFYIIRTSMVMPLPTPGRQVLGLTTILGSLPLAETMAPEPDVLMIMGDKDPVLMTELQICQDCYSRELRIAYLVEKRSEAEQSEKEGKDNE